MPGTERIKLTAIICLALAVGTFAIYFPTAWHLFINDDDPDYVLDNPHVNAGLTDLVRDCLGIQE